MAKMLVSYEATFRGTLPVEADSPEDAVKKLRRAFETNHDDLLGQVYEGVAIDEASISVEPDEAE